MTMRTIKFRGKRIDDGKWIYGYLAGTDSINNIDEVAYPNEDVAHRDDRAVYRDARQERERNL